MQEVGGWLGGNLQRLQTRGEGLPSAPDARDLDVTSVSPDAQNECLFLVLPQASVDIRRTTGGDDIVDLRIYYAVDHALKPIWGMKPLLSQLTGNISFNLWHHPKTPNFCHDPWDVVYYKSTT